MPTSDVDVIRYSRRVFTKLKTDAKNGNDYAFSVLKQTLEEESHGLPKSPKPEPEPEPTGQVRSGANYVLSP